LANPRKHETFQIEVGIAQSITFSVNIARIHANAISKDDVMQDFHFRLMEFTFLQFGVKSNLSKFLQNEMYMVFMVLHVS